MAPGDPLEPDLQGRRTLIDPDLGAALDHEFHRPDLLSAALTHTSAESRRRRSARAYERLEFLGDRVLALVIASLLMERFPDAPEGDLSTRLHSLVRAETLVRVARRIALDRHLRLTSDRDGADRTLATALADGLEALIGALFLDGGLDVAARFIRRHWALELAATAHALPREAKTELQEWLQARGLGLPHYEVVKRAGPAHRPVFRVAVSTQRGESAEADGPSKRAAESAAAELLLEQLKAGGNG